MDFGPTHTTPGHASLPPPAGESRPPPGFYISGSSVFYVSPGASVFLLRTGDERACLHPCRQLPETATAATTSRMGPTLELLARTADQLCRPTGPLSSVQAEVRRDRIVALGAFCQAALETVAAEIGTLLMDDASPDPEGFHERLTGRLLEIREQSRALNHQRAIRRGERANMPVVPDVPFAAMAFAHRGNYIGRYADMVAAGAAITGRLANAVEYLRDAHLRGELWTISRDGMIYAFRCPSDPL